MMRVHNSTCNNPLVLAHARALLTSSQAGSTDYIDADLNDLGAVIGIAREKLDFSRPVTIMLMGILGHIGNPAENDDQVAREIRATWARIADQAPAAIAGRPVSRASVGILVPVIVRIWYGKLVLHGRE